MDVAVIPHMQRALRLLPEPQQPAFIRFGVSAVVMLLCCGVQYAVYRLAGTTGLFLLLPGIFVAGMMFDRACAFFATVLGAAAAIFIIFQRGRVVDAAVAVPIVLFILTGFATGVVSEGLRKALERIQRSEKEKDLLLRELRHRTKNDIMNMGALLRLQSRRASAQETKDALLAAAGRVEVLGEVYDFLHNTRGDTPSMVEMDRYLDDVCLRLRASFRGLRPIAIEVEADNVHLLPSQAIPIGIITNELVTNSLKYAFPGERTGTISIRLRRDAEIELVVEDDGVGCRPDAREGLGSVLLQLLTRQLRGTMTRRPGAPGCRVEVRIPA